MAGRNGSTKAARARGYLLSLVRYLGREERKLIVLVARDAEEARKQLEGGGAKHAIRGRHERIGEQSVRRDRFTDRGTVIDIIEPQFDETAGAPTS